MSSCLVPVVTGWCRCMLSGSDEVEAWEEIHLAAMLISGKGERFSIF